MSRRIHRVLVVAGFLALAVGLSPSAAQAEITCNVHNYRYCSIYICCEYTCVSCIDSTTGESDTECSDIYCYNKFN